MRDKQRMDRVKLLGGERDAHWRLLLVDRGWWNTQTRSALLNRLGLVPGFGVNEREE